MFRRIPKNLPHLVCAFGSSVVVYKYHSYLGTVVYCEGISMEPTVNDGDYLLVERVSIARRKIKKGDIVVAGQPRRFHNFSHVLKRIKALEEEHVTYWDEAHWNNVTQEVPPNHVWLEGDNSGHSLDSRNYGPVPISRLEYRVLLRLWPLKSFGRLNSLGSVSSASLNPSNSSGLTTSVEACSDDYGLLENPKEV